MIQSLHNIGSYMSNLPKSLISYHCCADKLILTFSSHFLAHAA